MACRQTFTGLLVLFMTLILLLPFATSLPTADVVGKVDVNAVLTYFGPITPNAETNVTSAGTVQEVEAQIKKVNPKYRGHFETPSANENSHVLAANTPLPQPICKYNEPLVANFYDAQTCQRQLGGLPGSWYIEKGFGRCGRICCVGKTEIVLCNDNTEQDLNIGSSYVANMVGTIRSFCVTGADLWGQLFDTTKFNVIVGGVNSC